MRIKVMPLACGAFALAFSFLVNADDGPRVAPIARGHYPALLFVQEDSSAEPSARRSLMAANLGAGKVEVRNIMAAQYIKATQLDHAIFMLKAEHFPEDHSDWSQEYLLADFSTGDIAQLSKSKSLDKLVHLSCLRSNPDMGEAVILRYGQGTSESSLIRVDLRSLTATTLFNIPRTDATIGFRGPHMKISPDFKRLAAMVGGRRQGETGRQAYYLRVLDLDTLQTIDLDTEVMVEISPISSVGRGTAPFEWITPTEILYQHIVPENALGRHWRHDAEHVLKCANVASGATDVWLTKRMPLTLRGGTMHHDWLTQRLLYHDLLVDTQRRKLVARRPSHVAYYSPGPKEIRFRGELLEAHPPNPSHAQGLVSPSEDNFAYFVRYDNKTASPSVYAKTADMKQAVQVSEVPFSTTLVAWIEDAAQSKLSAQKGAGEPPR